MKIHLSPIHETQLTTLLPERAVLSRSHGLVSLPEEADLILLVGSFGRSPHYLLEHPLYRRFPERCAVYTEDDNYLPLAPGVYCAAVDDESTRAGRIVSYSYVSASGLYANSFLPTPETGKRYLFSFLGGSTSLLRKRLYNLRFDRDDVLIENTSSYHHWDLEQPGRLDRQKRYAEILAASSYVLCPRGASAGTIRLFEVMSAGVAPVLLSDHYALPAGVPWESFLLRFPEREIGRLPQLLEPHRAEAAERGRVAREVWNQYFAPDREFDYIVEAAARTLRHGPPSEEIFRQRQQAMITSFERRRRLRLFARNALLKTLKVLHLKPPYQMNR